MEEEKGDVEIKKRKEEIISWLKNPYNSLLLLVLVFAFIVRLYFFVLTKNQAAWWDEAQYLLNSKIAFGIENFSTEWILERPALIYLIFGALFKIGLSDLMVRFIEIILSLVGVFAVYLIGKEMFDKKVGIFAAALSSVFWVDLFFSQRFMLEIPSTALGLLGMYIFWKGYVKKEIKKYWIWLGLFLGLSAMVRHTGLLFLIILMIYLFINERFAFLKKKNLWMSFGMVIGLQIFSLILVVFFSNGTWFSKYFFYGGTAQLGGVLASGTRMGFTGIFNYLKMMPNEFFGGFFGIMGWLMLLSLIYSIIKNILIADITLKSKNYDNSKEALLLIWIIINFVFFGYFVSHIEPRYLIYAFPPLFILLGKNIFEFKKFKDSKSFMIVLAIALVLIAIFTQLKIANQIITLKADSYIQVKDSGKWIKENSEKGETIITRSFPQHMFYSSREAIWTDEGGEQGLMGLIKEKNPKYFVLSIFEIHPEWIYLWPQKYPEVFIPVKVYPLSDNQPALIVYNVDYSNISKFQLMNSSSS